ncbi:MAG: pitrilysin family protein [Bacilli bacterium]|nr:pitrilysin family protein [Bacilli bacterium]
MKVYKEKINNTDIIFVKTDRFKTNYIKIAFKGEFNKENAGYRVLLNKILKNSCSKYKTKKEVLMEAYKMYATSFNISSTVQYKMNITSFSASFIKQGPIEIDLTDAVIDYMKEFILHPDIENNEFNKKVFDEVKRLEKEKIISRYDRKETYAVDRILEIMGKDSLLSIKPYGSIEDIENITSKKLYEFYQNMFKSEEICIFVIGDYTLKRVKDVVKKINIYNNTSNLDIPFEIKKDEIAIAKQEVLEKKDIEQSILLRGYRVKEVSYDDKEKYPILCFLLIFGSGPFSRLFETVREKNSLVYDIDASIDFSYHIMLLYAGIDSKNANKTRELIEEELNKIKKGIISKNLLSKAKHTLLRQLKSLDDSFSRMISFYEMQYFFKNDKTIKDKIKIIKEITINDIVKVANNVLFDSEFLLEGR